MLKYAINTGKHARKTHTTVLVIAAVLTMATIVTVLAQLSLTMAPGGTATAAVVTASPAADTRPAISEQALMRAIVTGATVEIDGRTYTSAPVPSWLQVRPVPPSLRRAGRFGPRCAEIIADGHLGTFAIVCPDGRVEVQGM